VWPERRIHYGGKKGYVKPRIRRTKHQVACIGAGKRKRGGEGLNQSKEEIPGGCKKKEVSKMLKKSFHIVEKGGHANTLTERWEAR